MDARVLLITGASSGIGAATARAAARDGWKVALAARSEERLNALVNGVGGGRAFAQRWEVTDFEDQERLVAATVERFGRLDAAFANAGFGAKRGFLEETPEHWRAMVETNVLGVAYTIRAVLPHFKERGAGHFVLTSSVAGRRPLPGSLYSATKFAVTAMGHALRAELAETNLRVTLIEPGMVDTPFFERRPSDALKDEDVARTVTFALSQPPHVEINEILMRPVRQAG